MMYVYGVSQKRGGTRSYHGRRRKGLQLRRWGSGIGGALRRSRTGNLETLCCMISNSFPERKRPSCKCAHDDDCWNGILGSGWPYAYHSTFLPELPAACCARKCSSFITRPRHYCAFLHKGTRWAPANRGAGRRENRAARQGQGRGRFSDGTASRGRASERKSTTLYRPSPLNPFFQFELNYVLLNNPPSRQQR